MPGDNASANRHAELRAHIRAVLHKLSTPTRPVRQRSSCAPLATVSCWWLGRSRSFWFREDEDEL